MPRTPYQNAHDRDYADQLRRDFEDIDRNVCAESACDACGHRGLIFLATGQARCPQCKTRLEF